MSLKTAALALGTAAALSAHATAAVIAQQGFEGTAADTYAYTVTGQGGGVTSTSGTTFPAGSSVIRTGASAYVQNATVNAASGAAGQSGTVTFGSVSLATYTGVSVQIALAALGRTSSNGLDTANVGTGLGDFVQVFVALNGNDFSATPDLIVGGRSNAQWAYSATGVAETTAGTSATFAPAAGGVRTTDGYSQLIVDLPATATSVAVKVVSTNDNTGEIWAIDDVSVNGTSVPEPAALGVLGVGGALALSRRRRGV